MPQTLLDLSKPVCSQVKNFCSRGIAAASIIQSTEQMGKTSVTCTGREEPSSYMVFMVRKKYIQTKTLKHPQ